MVENFITVYEELPFKIKGFVMYDIAEDYYTIVLNSRQGFFENKKTFEHEIGHILNGDFFKSRNVEVLETWLH